MKPFDHLDFFVIGKAQQALNFLGKKFGVSKSYLLVNLFHLYIVGIILEGYLTVERDGLKTFYIFIWIVNFIICCIYGPKLTNISCQSSTGPFQAYIFLRPIRWILFHLTFPLGILVGVENLLEGSKEFHFTFLYFVGLFNDLVLFSWAYLACCNEPPPKERKDTVSKLAYQHY